MIKKKIFVLTLILLLSISVKAENSYYDQYNQQNYSKFLMNYLPGMFFPNFFLENFSADTVLTVEENNGFSLFDNPLVYFEGNSVTDFKWQYNGFNIDSSIDNGRSAVLLPFSSITSYKISGDSPVSFRNGLDMVSHMEEGITVFLSNVFGNMGSYTFLGPTLIQPEHPIERAEMLFDTRRKIKNSYITDISYNRSFGKNTFSFSFSNTFMKRQFNDLTIKNSTYDENLSGLFLSTFFKRDIKKGLFEIHAVLNSSKRGNLFSELGRLKEETYSKENSTLFMGIRFKKSGFKFDLSFISENDKTSPYALSVSKDLLDNDGEGIYPFEKFGKIRSGILSGNVEQKLINRKKTELKIFGDLRYSGLYGNEDIYKYNTLLFGGEPYRVIKMKGNSPYSDFNTKIRSGLMFKTSIGKQSKFLLKALIDYSKLSFKNGINNFDSLDPVLDMGISFPLGKANISFYAGRYPVDMNENINFFLEQNRPYGAIYNWDDINSDKLYEEGEESDIIGYTGGKYHFLDKNLKRPFYNRALIIFNTPISTNFSFNLKGLLKKSYNPLRVQFNKEYGFYENSGGEDLYFFDKPYKDFYLTNGNYDKYPFYGELLLNISGSVKEKWFFSFSFMAHIGMGYTAFGNGPTANDIGVINESMADPNSLINGYGRVDGDRGFVSKMFFGFHINRNIFFSTSIKYRDGDPFAFLNSYYKYGQHVIYYSTIQAEDERGVKGGPREDYISDMTLKLVYRFRIFKKMSELSLSFFNILDIGGELSEYVFSGGERYAMEMQLPKSLRLNLSIKL